MKIKFTTWEKYQIAYVERILGKKLTDIESAKLLILEEVKRHGGLTKYLKAMKQPA